MPSEDLQRCFAASIMRGLPLADSIQQGRNAVVLQGQRIPARVRDLLSGASSIEP
jgi:hypothetical protein